MPYKDPEKRLAAERERQRCKRAGAVNGATDFFSTPFFSTPPPLPERPTVADLTAAVAVEINRVRAAKVETLARARCVGYLAGVLLKSLEVGEIEQRLKALEEKLSKEVTKGGPRNELEPRG